MRSYEDGLRAAYTSVLLWIHDLGTPNESPLSEETYIADAEERWRVLEKGICLAIDTTHNRFDVKEDQ